MLLLYNRDVSLMLLSPGTDVAVIRQANRSVFREVLYE